MDLEKTLKNYGLTEKQAKIYLACLELGSAPVQKISQKASLPRSTCYEILEFLKQQNLVSAFLKKKTKYFSAADPKEVISLAKERVNLLEQALPEFEMMYGQSKTRPSVRYYQGLEGMKLVFKEIARECKELLAFNSADDMFEIVGDYWPKFIQERMKRKIPVRVILRDSPKARERQRLGLSELRDVKLISPDYEFHGMIFIWERKVAMFSFKKDLVVLVIESEEMAKVQKAMFNNLWQRLEK
ncbi:MAG: helix-turn-helix domain-containing protein [Candidatus Buchananbacteria bacterium]